MEIRKQIWKIGSAILTGLWTFSSILDIVDRYNTGGFQILSNLASSPYELIVVFAGLTAFPLWLGYQIHAWRTRKTTVPAQSKEVTHAQEYSMLVSSAKPTGALEGLDRAELTTRAMLGYRGLLKLDLLEIAKKFENAEQLQFHWWNNTQPDLKKQLIGDDDLYNALQDFSSSLNERNNSVGKRDFEIWNNSTKNHFDKLSEMGFVNARSNGLSVQIPAVSQVLPKRETLQRGLDELSVLDEAQEHFPSTASTFTISNMRKINHQRVLEICRDLRARELLEVKEMNDHALVKITSRGQNALKELG